MQNNPYTTLGVAQDVDADGIRSAYRALIRQWHPDRNSASNAVRKAAEINSAYELLSDPEQRRRYDLAQREVHTRTYPASYPQTYNHTGGRPATIGRCPVCRSPLRRSRNFRTSSNPVWCEACWAVTRGRWGRNAFCTCQCQCWRNYREGRLGTVEGDTRGQCCDCREQDGTACGCVGGENEILDQHNTRWYWRLTREGRSAYAR